MSTNRKSFDLGYKIIHWLMATLVLLMFFGIVGFAQAITDEERTVMLVGHSSLGTLISIFVTIRIYKRFIKKDAVPEQNISNIQRRASFAVQYAIYILLVVIPFSGYLAANFHELPVLVFGNFNINGGREFNQALFENLRSIHQLGIYSLMGLLVLHIGAALLHGIVRRDGVLGSMTRFKKPI
ncbi:cytochrome b [Colwellia psychrerythraea]|uniref:Di-heme cytochrome, transmembrane n=1 Tax=Colwellia psychrerythraea TaxID=28229 RepID=A0A099K9Y3_COLPS|nr:cytochrome b/b6 domain-containing protein [Colwellia psychrerythraea]KGJ87529.1 Di-heme cytochrome, transmembrane [Colwellia psychrerythraea]